MSYNLYNNDLPTPPPGWPSWRAAYASMLKYMAAYEGGMPPLEANAAFVNNFQRVRSDADEPAAIEVPYWKMAHYAAREQAEEDAKYPPLAIGHLMELALYRVGPTSEPVKQWLERKIEEAHATERMNNA